MRLRTHSVVLPLALTLFACSGEDTGNDPLGTGGTAPGLGGSPGTVTNGGATSVLSTPLFTGGTTNLVSATGGATSTGGVVSTGGTTSIGGTKATGGTSNTGGTKATGGTSNTGGTKAIGGTTSTGGTKATGGTSSTGGTKATGGTTSTGGTKATGGTTSTGGTTNTGGTSSTCNVAPVNPKATQQAKNLLCYLYSIYGKSVLSGQQETSWSNPANDISWYASNGMKYPAILGGDYLYPSGTSTRAIAYWNAGGITMIRYHMGAPPNADTYDYSKGTANIANVLTAGTNENASFVSKLDYIATELKKLQDANVPVLWAPFHEYQPNGWFWWSKGTPAQFIELWKYMFNYLTNTKGLNNLVWLAPSSGSPNASWYPGKAYLDIAGPDTYDNNQPFTSMFSAAKQIIGSQVPIALHETGLIPTPSAMFPSAAPWVLFNIWAGYQSDGQHNTTANVKSVYESPYTITRDEVPNLK